MYSRPIPKYEASAIVYKDGDKVIARDRDGKLIAKGKAEVDDADIIQKAIDVVGEQGGGLVKINSGTYLIDKTINMKNRVILLGNNTILKLNKDVVCINCNGNEVSESGWMTCGIENIIFDGNEHKYKNPILLLHHVGHVAYNANEPLFFRHLTFRNHGGFVIRFLGQVANIESITGINVFNCAGRYTFTARDGSTQYCPIIHCVPYENDTFGGRVTDVYISNSHFEDLNGPFMYIDYLFDERTERYVSGINLHNVHVETTPDLSIVPKDSAYIIRGGNIYNVKISNCLFANIFNDGIPFIDVDGIAGLQIENTHFTNPSPLINSRKLSFSKINCVVSPSGTFSADSPLINVVNNEGIIENTIFNISMGYLNQDILIDTNICSNVIINSTCNYDLKINIRDILNSRYVQVKGNVLGILKKGILQITGDGTTTTFTVSTQHGLITDNISKISVVAAPSKPCQIAYNLVDNDGDGFKETLQFTLTFTTAPASGETIYLRWKAEVIL